MLPTVVQHPLLLKNFQTCLNLYNTYQTVVQHLPYYTKHGQHFCTTTSVAQIVGSCMRTLRSILMLSSHLRLGLPSGLLPSGLPTKILCAPLTSAMHATYHTHLILRVLITLIILGEEYKPGDGIKPPPNWGQQRWDEYCNQSLILFQILAALNIADFRSVAITYGSDSREWS
jgi:hypothetical protein